MKDLFFKTIMLKGEAGGTISKIEKTGSSLNVDTYTITFNDGETQTFEVTNGSSIASIEKTDTSGLLDTYTVTLTDGSTTQFVVRNGEDGAGYEVPAGSVLFYDPDGDDSAPEGYEASSDPNGAAIAALERGLDNNLVLCGDFSSFVRKPGSNTVCTCGWSFYKDAGSPEPHGWAPVQGLMLGAGCSGRLIAPKLASYSLELATDLGYTQDTTFSVSVIFSGYYGVGDLIPLTTAKIEGVSYSNRETNKYNYNDIFEIEVETIIEGGYFRLKLKNLSSDTGIAIKAIKLERGGIATPFRYMSPQNGLAEAIAQYIDVNPVSSNLAYGEIDGSGSYSEVIARLESALSSMSDGAIRIYSFVGTYTGTIFTGGARQFVILYRYESGIYHAFFPCGYLDGYYYDSEWHWRRSSSEVVTPT